MVPILLRKGDGRPRFPGTPATPRARNYLDRSKSGRRGLPWRPWLVGRTATYITLPPLVVHSPAFAASVQPWPLQAFMPLQADEAVLQALVPLQELTPVHFTV